MTVPVALVVGHVTLDLSGGARLPGGSVYYAAHALAALGARVRVLTAAGADLPGDVFHAGTPGTIDALVLPAPSTTLFENVYAHDGRRSQRVHAGAAPLDPASLPMEWREADLLLLAPVLGELEPAAFARAVSAGVVGVCVQGLVREVRAGGAVVTRRLASELAGVEAAFVGDDEAQGQPDLVGSLLASVPLVFATHGVRGCEVVRRGGVARVGIHPASEVDPTGAGDVFAAAALLSLAAGDDPVAAARLGAAAASIVVEGRGGEALPRVGEARQRVARVPVG